MDTNKREQRTCGVCGYEWILRPSGEPVRCPNRGCRSMRWRDGVAKIWERPKIGNLKLEPVRSSEAAPLRPVLRDSASRVAKISAADPESDIASESGERKYVPIEDL